MHLCKCVTVELWYVCINPGVADVSAVVDQAWPSRPRIVTKITDHLRRDVRPEAHERALVRQQRNLCWCHQSGRRLEGVVAEVNHFAVGISTVRPVCDGGRRRQATQHG